MATKSLTYGKYRAVDITIFALLIAVIEYILTVLSNSLSDVNITFSVIYVISALVMMRWGAWCAIHLAIGGIVHCVAAGAALYQYVAFTVGNLFALLSLVYIKLVGYDRVQKSYLLTAAHVIIVYALIVLGRAALLAIFSLIGFGASSEVGFGALFIGCCASDALSLVISLVILLIARRQDGLYENQKHYLIRTAKEREMALRNSFGDYDDTLK